MTDGTGKGLSAAFNNNVKTKDIDNSDNDKSNDVDKNNSSRRHSLDLWSLQNLRQSQTEASDLLKPDSTDNEEKDEAQNTDCITKINDS